MNHGLVEPVPIILYYPPDNATISHSDHVTHILSPYKI